MKFLAFLPARLVFLWTVCGILGGRVVGAENSPGDLKVGYFLLHDVCHEETQVSLIGMVKTMPDDVRNYIGRISKEAKMNVASIDKMEDRKPALKLEETPLPDFEVQVRSGIREDKQHQLLFGTKGPAFARALIVTQIEAANYILQISKLLADKIPSAGDTKTLLKMSARWTAFRDEGFRLLGNQ